MAPTAWIGVSVCLHVGRCALFSGVIELSLHTKEPPEIVRTDRASLVKGRYRALIVVHFPDSREEMSDISPFVSPSAPLQPSPCNALAAELDDLLRGYLALF